jgi:hypothetical protein
MAKLGFLDEMWTESHYVDPDGVTQNPDLSDDPHHHRL